MHSVQGGYLDKALSYAEKAMHFISLESSSGMFIAIPRYVMTFDLSRSQCGRGVSYASSFA